jgi:hypothetical protein
MRRGLPCSNEKLVSMALHEVGPQVPLEQPPSLVESLLQRQTYMR